MDVFVGEECFCPLKSSANLRVECSKECGWFTRRKSLIGNGVWCGCALKAVAMSGSLDF